MVHTCPNEKNKYWIEHCVYSKISLLTWWYTFFKDLYPHLLKVSQQSMKLDVVAIRRLKDLVWNILYLKRNEGLIEMTISLIIIKNWYLCLNGKKNYLKSLREN